MPLNPTRLKRLIQKESFWERKFPVYCQERVKYVAVYCIATSEIWLHWHRLVKILEGQAQISMGQNVVITDKYMGVSQILGARARAPIKSTPTCGCLFHRLVIIIVTTTVNRILIVVLLLI